MDSVRNYEDVRRRVEDSIRWYAQRIELWKRVRIVTKKDGTPFKNFNMNFENADVGKYYPVEDFATPYLTVGDSFQRPNGGWEYVEDHMEVYVGSYNHRVPSHNEERETRTSVWNSTNEIMTFEEIEAEIRHRISEYERLQKEAEDDLARSEELFNIVAEDVECLKGKLKDGAHSSLTYALRDYIRGQF